MKNVLLKLMLNFLDVKDDILFNFNNLINECGKKKSHLQIKFFLIKIYLKTQYQC